MGIKQNGKKKMKREIHQNSLQKKKKILGEFAHVFADTLAELVDVVFLSGDSLFHVVFFLFEGVQVGPEFGDFFAEFFDSKMVDVEGLSALGEDLLLLFALGLAFVGFVLFGSSEVSTVVKGHVGNSLLLLVFFFFSLLFFFGFLLFSFFSLFGDLLLFFFLSFLHFDGSLRFAFLDSQAEFFKLFFIGLTFFEVVFNETLEDDEIFLLTLSVNVAEVNRLAIRDRQFGNIQGWGLWCWGLIICRFFLCSRFRFRFGFGLGFLNFWFGFRFWLGLWLGFFLNLLFDFFFDFFFDLLFYLFVFFYVRHGGCCLGSHKEKKQITTLAPCPC